MNRHPDDDLPDWKSPDPFRQGFHHRWDEGGQSNADAGRAGPSDWSPVSSLDIPPPRLGDPRWTDDPGSGPAGRPGGHRRTGTTRTTLTIAALTAAGLALVIGVYLAGERSPEADRSTGVGGSPTPRLTASAPLSAGTPPWNPSRPSAGSVVVGPGCPSNGNGAYFVPLPGVTALPDGWTGDGCAGRLDLIPLPDGPGVDIVASWTFNVASGGAASCDVGVYVPPIAAKFGPVSYRVEAGGAGGGRVFTITPTGDRGTWVNGGRHPVVGPTVKVVLLDLAGTPRGPTRIATQVSLSCGG